MSGEMFVVFHVQDVERSLRFYESLGFATRRHDRRGVSFGGAGMGGFEILLAPLGELSGEAREWVGEPPLGRGVVVTLRAADAEATWDKAKAQGATVDEPLEEMPWGGTGFRITDPDGYVLSFLERFPVAAERAGAEAVRR